MSTAERDRKVRGASVIEPGMLYFILADMSVFAIMFGAFLWHQVRNRAAFLSDAAHLSLPLGLTNTLILLWSSYCVAKAVEARRSDAIETMQRYFRQCLTGAAAFVVIKLLEYALAIWSGHSFVTYGFFSYYFIMTGLHLLHIVIGSTLIGSVMKSVKVGNRPSQLFVESSAAYWHMVDLLWLLIFSLLYIGGKV